MAARYKAQHEAAAAGENIVFTTPEPPVDVPGWWRTDSGVAAVTPLSEPPAAATDPNKIELRFGVLGRPRQHVANEGQPTVEDVFRKASLGDRVKAVFGVKL